jgi:hypothetical protein
LRCDHPQCTGSHNDRDYATLCPRSRENKRTSQSRSYVKHREARLEALAKRKTTAAYMLSQMRYEASRRGGRNHAPVESD